MSVSSPRELLKPAGGHGVSGQGESRRWATWGSLVMFAAAGLEEGDGKPFVGRLRGICINPSAAEGEVALASDPLGVSGQKPPLLTFIGNEALGYSLLFSKWNLL